MSEDQTATPIHLPLDVNERVVSYRDERGTAVRHVFKLPSHSAAEIRDFFQKSSDAQIERVRRARGKGYDLTQNLRGLYRSLILRAEGYALLGGGALSQLNKWIDRIPLGHRIQAIEDLTRVTRAERATQIDPEYDVVELEAWWNSSAAPDSQSVFTGLIHRLEPLTDEDIHKYENAKTRALKVEGAVEERWLLPAEANLAWDLYDRKIAAVEGYSVGNQPLADPTQIREWMDPFHKVAAMQVLLRPYVNAAAAEETEEAA